MNRYLVAYEYGESNINGTRRGAANWYTREGVVVNTRDDIEARCKEIEDYHLQRDPGITQVVTVILNIIPLPVSSTTEKE